MLTLLVVAGMMDVVKGTWCDPTHAIASGGTFNCGLGYGPSVTCWGSNYHGQLNIPESVIATGPKYLAAGSSHVCAIGSADNAVCWGDATSGGLNVPPGRQWSSIQAGYRFTCGIEMGTKAGFCWGSNNFGQVQNMPSGHRWNQIYAADIHACGVTTEGVGLCWGFNGRMYEEMKGGQCDVPAHDTGWRYICGGGHFSCGLLQNGTVDCWGRNQFRQLDVPSGSYTQLQCGSQQACATKTDGTTICWGSNMHGQLDVPQGYNWTAFSMWDRHACGITTNGTTKCWGRSEYGCLTEPDWALNYCVTDVPAVLSAPTAGTTVSAKFNLTFSLPEPARSVNLMMQSTLGDNVTLTLREGIYNLTSTGVGSHSLEIDLAEPDRMAHVVSSVSPQKRFTHGHRYNITVSYVSQTATTPNLPALSAPVVGVRVVTIGHRLAVHHSSLETSQMFPHQNLSTITVAVTDEVGGVVEYGADSRLYLSVSILSGTGSLVGETTVQAINGVATFRAIRIAGKGAPGIKRLRFSPMTHGACNCIAGVDTASFTIENALGASLHLIQGPPPAVIEGRPFQGPLIYLRDIYGYVILDGPDSMLDVQVTVVRPSVNSTAAVTLGALQRATEGALNVSSLVVGGGEGAYGAGGCNLTKPGIPVRS